jgi:hypothetical protein
MVPARLVEGVQDTVFSTDANCSQFQPTGGWGLFAGFVSYFAIRLISVPSTEEDRSCSSASAIFFG